MPEETNRILNDLRARLALGTALATMALGGYGGRPAYAGACTGAAGIYLCSGAANPATDLTQTLNPGAPLTVTTTPGFGIDTSTNGGNALTLTGTGGLSFTDGYNAAITGAATGIRALGQGEYDYSYGYGPGTIPGSGGALHITMAGRVTGLSGHGIDAENTEDGSDLTISAATVDGGNAGIFAHNEGTGYLSISASGPVTGTLGDGIYGKNFGTALSVTAAAVTGGRDGIDARNEGTAGLSISVSGDVTGQSVDGISAFNSANDVSGSMLITQAASTTTSGAVHGIDADNAGGALTINALGTSTGGSGDGIHALNRAGTTALDITANNAHGGANGIVADNAGGALTINAYGSASGGTGDGIRAVNQAGATGLTITANNADGGASGIRADNQGSGALRITATGQVTGSGTGQAFSNAGVDGGIVARNSSATATDLTIDASGQVTGAGRYGIYARNDGTGDLRVTTTGQVTGWVRPDGRRYEAIVAYNFGRDLTIAATAGYAHGITAVNSGSGALRITTATTSNGRMFAINTGTDLTIAAAAVSSGFQGGIYAYNHGTGVSSITATGPVTAGSRGIVADTGGTDLTIAAAAVSGSSGIYAEHWGTGTARITTTGLVTANSGDGIHAYNYNPGTGLTISTAAVSARDTGIYAINRNTGDLRITAAGPVTGTLHDGIQAWQQGADLTISTAAVTGGRHGIYAGTSGFGSDTLTVTAAGAITGGTGDGIHALTDTLTVEATRVTGDTNGIYARNAGSGPLSVTVSVAGDVTGQAGDGISALNSATGPGSGLLIGQAAGSTATGAVHGIDADNAGGALTINAYGSASGGTGDGIRAVNQAGASGLTITANNAEGGASGIRALNQGSGALSITATGQVMGSGTGQARSSAGADGGIVARNSNANATDLTIDASGQVTGAGGYGIYARNDGTGDLRVTTTGQVTGWVRPDGRRYEAIYAYNQGRDLTIAATAGYAHGITALNTGSGALRITTATTSNGRMFAVNTGTDLTIAAAAVSSGFQGGIYAYNHGTGASSITATGPVTAGSRGIVAKTRGTDLTITAAAVSGSNGIYAGHEGTGTARITTTGLVTGNSGYGIRAYNLNHFSTADLTISTAAVSARDTGIYAANYGPGALNISATGPVTGTLHDGIRARQLGMDLTISTAAVSGGHHGIYARAAGSFGSGTSTLTVTAAGAVTGGTGDGIRALTGLGGQSVIALNDGALVSSTSGNALSNDAGNSITTVNAGAGIAGSISLGDGSDALTFDGGSFAGVSLFDGGDDTGSADGFVDSLSFLNAAGLVAGANIVNFEEVAIGSGADIGFSDNTLTTESLTISDGGRLNLVDGVGANFLLQGDLNLANGGTLATEILSASQFDIFNVAGAVNFGLGGLFDFVFDVDDQEFDLFSGLSLTFLTADSILGFENLAFNFLGLDPRYAARVRLEDGSSLSLNFSTSVPAPSPLALLASGLLGLAGLGRARRHHPSPDNRS